MAEREGEREGKGLGRERREKERERKVRELEKDKKLSHTVGDKGQTTFGKITEENQEFFFLYFFVMGHLFVCMREKGEKRNIVSTQTQ